MDWIQGPISDHAIFWFGVKVFWWKRLITVLQLLLGSSIFLTLLTAEHKRRLSDSLEEKRAKAQGVVVPPVVRFRKLAAWFAPFVLAFATGLAYLTHLFVQQNHQPVPFWPAWFFWAFVLAMLSLPMAEIVIAVSMLRSGIRGVQRYAPPLLAWFLNHERFDRNVTVTVFAALVLVTGLQICLS
ncbi:MAG TPA: hypothetical protein VK324_00155 [Tepidisphaeraceae bacterium]|nr:hypothetical protein [Tepidisphaeraceae bacterium]